MTNDAQAKQTRNQTWKSIMFSNSAVYTNDVAMPTINIKFTTDCGSSVTSSIAAEIDNSGYSL